MGLLVPAGKQADIVGEEDFHSASEGEKVTSHVRSWGAARHRPLPQVKD